MAAERGYEVVAEFIEKASGAKTKRPALDRLLAEARRGHFDLVIVWSCDRIGRSTRHFLDLLDEYYPAEEAQRQFETAVEWGRYAELFEYDAVEERLTLSDGGVAPVAG